MIEFKLSAEDRRHIACQFVQRLTAVSPSPADFAAIAVAVSEIARESILHTCERHGHDRAELARALDEVASQERAATQATTVRVNSRDAARRN